MEQYHHVVHVEFDRNKFSQAKQWCNTNLGKEGNVDKPRKWRGKAEFCDCNFYFRNEEDASLFKMMWG